MSSTEAQMGISARFADLPTLNAQIYGDGAPLLLLHGLGDSSHDWDLILPALLQAGFRVYALDLPGHGGSAWLAQAADYTAQNFSASLEAWIAGLELAEHLYLVGHSLGGYLALDYTIRHPAAVRSLALISPFFSTTQLPPMANTVLGRTSLGEQFLRHLPNWLIPAGLRLAPLIQAEFPAVIQSQKAVDYKKADPRIMRIPTTVTDLSSSLASIQTPTCIVWGKNDLTLRPSSFNELVKSLPSCLWTRLGTYRSPTPPSTPRNRAEIDPGFIQ